MTSIPKNQRRGAMGLAASVAFICAALATPVAVARERVRGIKFACPIVKSAPDDPIVFPNRPGASHLHDFYGNVGVDAETTRQEDLMQFASSCGNGDRSSYWTPAVFQNGKKLKPSEVKVYYENKSLAAGPLRPFPVGYKIALGNARATTESETEPHWIWACSQDTGFSHTPPAHCPTGQLQLRSEFPNCWDGKLQADGNAAGHVTWANGLPGPGRGDSVVDPSKNTCPAAYPIPLPMLRVVVTYKTGKDIGDISSASSNGLCSASEGGALAASKRQGSVYAKHGDFFNGWDPVAQQAMVDRCLNTPYSACEPKKKGARLPILPLAGAGVQFGGFPQWVAGFVASAVR